MDDPSDESQREALGDRVPNSQMKWRAELRDYLDLDRADDAQREITLRALPTSPHAGRRCSDCSTSRKVAP